MHDIRALDSHTLFAASDWMRRIAKALVHDDDRADDLVQEAWQAALRNPPRAGLRPWLGGILRRKAKEAHRARANRSAREERAAVPERQASSAELAACAEEQRYLIDCVLALPEKYREVLLLRFYEDLAPRLVAERLEIPVNTVRTQTQRALERLRERLDDRHDGDRRAWGMALLPLAEPHLPASAPPLLHALHTTWGWMGLAAILAGTAMLVTGAGRGWLGLTDVDSEITSIQHEVRATGDGLHPPSNSTTRTASPRLPLSKPESSQGTWNIQGSIYDEITKAPLAAFVQIDERPPQLSTAKTGAFEFSTSAPRNQIRVFHPKYEPAILPLSGGGPRELDLGRIELRPALTAQITALDEFGTPLSGVRCVMTDRVLKELGGREPLRAESFLRREAGVTDGQGELVLPLAEARTVLSTDLSGRMSASHVNPASEVELRFLGSPRSLLVLDADTGEPIAGRAFPLGWSTDRTTASFCASTGPDGRLDLPSGPGHLEIGKSAPRLLLHSLRASDELLGESVNGFSLRAVVSAEETDLMLFVQMKEHRVTLIDARSNQPIDGELWCHIQRFDAKRSTWQSSTTERTTQVRHGDAILGEWIACPDTGDKAELKRRWMVVPGYEITFFPATQDLRGATLALEPAPTRDLYLHDEDGNPLQTMVHLALVEGVRLRLRSDAEGFVGTLPWSPGQSWSVACPLLRGQVSSVPLEASRLAEESTIRLRLPIASGSILVRGVPRDGPPIFAGSDFLAPLAARYSGTDALFEGLPEGHYVVGSKEYLEHGLRRGSRGFFETTENSTSLLHMQVSPGQQSEIHWNPEWISGTSLTGRVQIGIKPGVGLAVLPLFSDVSSTISFGDETPWRAVNSEGVFSTDPTAPTPRAFLFARRGFGPFGRRFTSLDVLPLREDGEYSLSLTSVELSCKGAHDESPSPLVSVTPLGNSEGFTLPMNTPTGLWDIQWDPSEPLRIEDLPANIDRLKLHVHGHSFRQAFEIPVNPGTRNRLEVTLPLEEPKRAPSQAPALQTK